MTDDDTTCTRPERCYHNVVGHCCRCLDCARFEREPDWCARCGLNQRGIGWNSVCSACEQEMAAEAPTIDAPTGEHNRYQLKGNQP